MGFKRILGILVLVGGIVLLGVSYYIKQRVAEGQIEVSSAQKKVDRSSSLFSLNPVSKQLGQGMTDSAQKKIDQGNQQIDEYTVLANRLQIGGFILGIAGVLVIIFGKKRKA